MGIRARRVAAADHRAADQSQRQVGSLDIGAELHFRAPWHSLRCTIEVHKDRTHRTMQET